MPEIPELETPNIPFCLVNRTALLPEHLRVNITQDLEAFPCIDVPPDVTQVVDNDEAQCQIGSPDFFRHAIDFFFFFLKKIILLKIYYL